MKRVKWFYIGLPSSYQSFLKKLSSNSIDSSSNFGFLEVSADTSGDRFKYLCRSKVSITVLDASGDATLRLIDVVNTIDFEVFTSAGKTWLRVDDPPRSFRDFFNSLETLLGMDFSVTPVKFPFKLQRTILSRLDSCQMVGFKGLGTDNERKVIARIEVASKEGTNPNELPFLKGLQYSIDHATYDVTYKMIKGQISFKETGVVRITGQLEPFLLDCLQSNLKNSVPAN
jgi:hypothetical protein